jgi:hypothetical protein
MKLIKLTKMYLNEAYNEIRIGKCLSDNVSIQNGLKEGDALSPLILTLFWNMPLWWSRKTMWD